MFGRKYKMCSASENDFYRNYNLNNGALAVEIMVKWIGCEYGSLQRQWLVGVISHNFPGSVN